MMIGSDMRESLLNFTPQKLSNLQAYFKVKVLKMYICRYTLQNSKF